jgi:kynurenine formamidase
VRERSNWGRFGDDDERGMANLLQGETVLRALRAPVEGTVYQLGILIERSAPVAHNRTPPIHLMSLTGADYAAVGNDDAGSADDYIFIGTHGSSHVDALAHVWREGRMYNGFSHREIRSSGTARCGIEKAGPLVAAAHLLDFTGFPTVEPGVIGPADLDRWAEETGRTFSPGDALLLRTGWMDHALGRRGAAAAGHPVLGQDCVDWVADRDIALIGADNVGVELTLATPLPLHRRLIRDLGVYLLELLDLSEPAGAGVTGGLLVVAPLRIKRGVGSPVNPVLIV